MSQELDHLKTAATTFGLELTANQLGQFEAYYHLLAEWNQRMNLTRIIAWPEVVDKHFLDSLSCFALLPRLPRRVIDVGSGAGFPGLALKIAQPDIDLTLVEATGKKTEFLRHVVQALGLSPVMVLHQRAETIGQAPAHRARYHLAVARAVAPLAVLAEYLLPLLKRQGLMLAQKGALSRAELTAAAPAIKRLGGLPAQITPVSIPDLAAERTLVLVKKAAATPKQFPRRPGLPAKQPLT